MENHQLPHKEEVSISDLFSQIGRGFRAIGRGISHLFNLLFHTIISFILFVRKNILPVGGATVAGLITGLILDMNNDQAEEAYTYNMVVKTNAGSGALLYQNLNTINALIRNGDTVALAEIFQIPPSETKNINKFSISPLQPEVQITEKYELFRLTTDTIITNHVDFDKFSKRYNDENLNNHTLSIVSKDKELIPTLSKIIPSLAQNRHFTTRQQSKLEQLLFKKKKLLDNLAKIDTINFKRLDIDYLKAKNPANITDFNLANNTREQVNYYDIAMIETATKLLDELSLVNAELEDYNTLFEIISSDYVPVVYQSITDKRWFRYALYGFILSLLFLYGIKFNKYLNRYESERQSA